MSCVKCVQIDGRVMRELNRKRRASEEYERMIARYNQECGECLSFKNEEEYEDYLKSRTAYKQNT